MIIAQLLIFSLVSIVVCSKQDEEVILKGGKFQIGINDINGSNGENPATITSVKAFIIDKFPVTNNDWKQFVKGKPKFVTDAETRGWSYVFVGLMNPTFAQHFRHHKRQLGEDEHMIPIIRARWSQPFGVGSNVTHKGKHPVVHVSQRDASAYCFWKGKRLPTEYEWEFAARGGLKSAEYTWGDTYQVGRVNSWQGDYPTNDTGRDGYKGTSPVDAYPPQNEYGLYDLMGNTWEWTSSTYYRNKKKVKGMEHLQALKGGSYLDSRKGHVNTKIRVSARNGRLPYYSAGNVGFRCAKSVRNPGNQKANRIVLPKYRQFPRLHSEL